MNHVAGLHAVRWRKYGKDRVYVNDEAGQRIGWLDLQTGANTLDQPEREAEFHGALVPFLTLDAAPGTAPGSSTLAAPPSSHSPDQGDASPEPNSASFVGSTSEWVDLADRVPGQAARAKAEEQAAALREEGRVRAWLTRTFDVKTDERNWRVGAGGEETVGAKLNRLRKHGWQVLHAVPVGAAESDIDHVIIGPGGVFTVNTKTHPGAKVWVGQYAVRVNGAKTNYLRNSRHEADRAGRLLTAACGFPVPVRPVLVFLTGTLIPDVTIKQTPDGVVVLDRMDIPSAFQRAARRLSDEQIAAIYDQARRSTTWRTRPKQGR